VSGWLPVHFRLQCVAVLCLPQSCPRVLLSRCRATPAPHTAPHRAGWRADLRHTTRVSLLPCCTMLQLHAKLACNHLQDLVRVIYGPRLAQCHTRLSGSTAQLTCECSHACARRYPLELSRHPPHCRAYAAARGHRFGWPEQPLRQNAGKEIVRQGVRSEDGCQHKCGRRSALTRNGLRLLQ